MATPHPNNINQQLITPGLKQAALTDRVKFGAVPVSAKMVLVSFSLLLAFVLSWVALGGGGWIAGSPMEGATAALSVVLARSSRRIWHWILVPGAAGLLLAGLLTHGLSPLGAPLGAGGVAYLLLVLPLATLNAWIMAKVLRAHSHAESALPSSAGIIRACALSMALLPVLGATFLFAFSPDMAWGSWLDWFLRILMGCAAFVPLTLFWGSTLRQQASLGCALRVSGYLLISVMLAWVSAEHLEHPYFIVLLALLLISARIEVFQAQLVTVCTIMALAAFVGNKAQTAPMDWAAHLHQLPLLAITLSANTLSALLWSMRSEARRLLISQNLFKNAMRLSPIGIGLTHLDGRFSQVNEALLRMLGWDGKEMAFMRVFDLVSKDDQEALKSALNQLGASQESTTRVVAEIRMKSGQTINTRLGASLMRNERGQPIGYVLQFEDFESVRKTKLALGAATARLDFLSQHSDLGILEIDFRSRSLRPSARLLKMLGLEELSFHEACQVLEAATARSLLAGSAPAGNSASSMASERDGASTALWLVQLTALAYGARQHSQDSPHFGAAHASGHSGGMRGPASSLPQQEVPSAVFELLIEPHSRSRDPLRVMVSCTVGAWPRPAPATPIEEMTVLIRLVRDIHSPSARQGARS